MDLWCREGKREYAIDARRYMCYALSAQVVRDDGQQPTITEWLEQKA